MNTSYREGQRDGLAVAMTVVCPHCSKGFFGPTAQNDIERDGRWFRDDMTTGIHLVNSKRRRCRAAKLIPLYRMAQKDAGNVH